MYSRFDFRGVQFRVALVVASDSMSSSSPDACAGRPPPDDDDSLGAAAIAMCSLSKGKAPLPLL